MLGLVFVSAYVVAEPSSRQTESSPAASGETSNAPALLKRLPWEHPPDSSASPSPSSADLAGIIFDNIPVPLGNYYFAKGVAYLFPRPLGAADLPEDQREDFIWESLILHYESFRRGITVTDQELEDAVNELLKSQEQSYTRTGDPQAYRHWVEVTMKGDVQRLENQVRFVLTIRTLKDHVREQAQVTVSDEEMHQEFLNEQHHVGGEMVTFDTKEAAQPFYEQHKTPKAWKRMKAKGEPKVRPVNLMTLEAYMDLWAVPHDQMYAFHALPLGTVGPPMPFGTKEWAVYRLLDKRVGDLKDFPKQRDSYLYQLTMKKKYEALTRWVKELKAAAHPQVFVK